jgi:hypothetical protein
MFNVIHLPSLAERRLRTRLVMMYTVSFHLVAVPSDILIVSDTMTRLYCYIKIFSWAHRFKYMIMEDVIVLYWLLLNSDRHYWTFVRVYLTHTQLRLFADDNIIYMPIKSQHDCNKLQQDLNAAARWKSDWLMAFHPDKCSVLSDDFPSITTVCVRLVRKTAIQWSVDLEIP